MEIIDNIRNSKTLYQNLKIIIEGINDQKGKIINEILNGNCDKMNVGQDYLLKNIPVEFLKKLGEKNIVNK